MTVIVFMGLDMETVLIEKKHRSTHELARCMGTYDKAIRYFALKLGITPTRIGSCRVFSPRQQRLIAVAYRKWLDDEYREKITPFLREATKG